MRVDSDEDQGFITNRILITHQTPRKQKPETINARPLDFQGRYIFGEGIMRKEPQEIYNRINQPLKFQNTLASQKIGKKYRQQIGHPYTKFFTNPEYKMIYSRSKDKSMDPDNDNFCKNEICLKSIIPYDESKFCILKPFDISSQPSMSSDLQFDSKFESGNLKWAFKNLESQQYVLFIQNDTNTLGYNQWFYFAIKNMKPKMRYKFRIVNFKKNHSFFKYGKPLAVYSHKLAQKTSQGWKYAGTNISYQKSQIISSNHSETKYFTLFFQLEAEFQDDYIMVAMNLPYSYSKLISNLNELAIEAKEKNISWQMVPIAHSLSNNAVPYLTITKQKKQKQSKNQQKKIIIFMARQHSGQVWSSYLMQEILRQLLAESVQSNWLLENFIIKVFPMVNVDGVIYGNFRCDLGGVDLNRNWKNPCKILHPQVIAIKEEIQNISKEYEVTSCFDLHGHSKQYNTFCYSCKTTQHSCRVLPYIFNQLNEQFYFPYCTFGISKYKKSTARATIFNAINKQNVLTIECSFFGSKINEKVRIFQPSKMTEMAKTILKGCKIYFNFDPQRQQTEKMIKSQLRQFIQYELINGDEDGSSSDPEGDEIPLNQKIEKVFPKSIVNSIPKVLLKQRKKFKNIKKSLTAKAKKSDERQEQKSEKKNKQVKQKPSSSSKKNQGVVLVTKQELFVERASLITYKKFTDTMKEKFKKSIQFKRDTEISKISGDEDKLLTTLNLKEKIPHPNTQKTIQLANNKNSKQLKLAAFGKSQLQPLKFKRTSQGFSHAQSSISDYKNEVRAEQQRKIMFTKDSEIGQFPHLCILSQSKKKNHYFNSNRNKNRRDQQLSVQLPKYNTLSNKMPRNSPKRADIYKRNHLEKKKPTNAQLLSKIWMDNVLNYNGKNSVFLSSKFTVEY